MVNNLPTDKQYDGQLIDEFYRLKDIKEIAIKENATETVKMIDKQINQIKLRQHRTKILQNSGKSGIIKI